MHLTLRILERLQIKYETPPKLAESMNSDGQKDILLRAD